MITRRGCGLALFLDVGKMNGQHAPPHPRATMKVAPTDVEETCYNRYKRYKCNMRNNCDIRNKSNWR